MAESERARHGVPTHPARVLRRTGASSAQEPRAHGQEPGQRYANKSKS